VKIAVGADHAGYAMKEALATRLAGAGHTVVDLGTGDGEAPVDYPDYAEAVGAAIIAGRAERGVLLCGSGVGASVSANKLPGIRAGLCHDAYSAHQGVEHDDMNILVLGARIIGVEVAWELVLAFIGAAYSAGERHERRLHKVQALEAKYLRAVTPRRGSLC
jgi:ribose 5-phosphate isomerase B